MMMWFMYHENKMRKVFKQNEMEMEWRDWGIASMRIFKITREREILS